MTLTSKKLILLTGAAFLLANAGVKAETTPSASQQTEKTTTIDKSTKPKDGIILFTPEKRLEINEDTVMEPFPG